MFIHVLTFIEAVYNACAKFYAQEMSSYRYIHTHTHIYIYIYRIIKNYKFKKEVGIDYIYKK